MLTQDDLRQWYIVDGLSLRQVAEKAGVSAGTIRYYMRRYGIPRRTKSEALSGDRNPMHGKVKPEDVRRRTSETLARTNADPAVRARRSAASKGDRNPMYGRTHTEEVKEASKQRLAAARSNPAFQEAHREAMAQPEVRQAISESAKQRTRERNPFFGKTHTEATKRKLSQANKGRFQGANGSNWQGGKTSVNHLVRNSEDMIRWRKNVFARDKFTCQDCGKVGGPLHADHIRPLAVLLRENVIQTLADAQACPALWDLSNGRTLCVPCHKKTPSFAGSFRKNFHALS
jgi:transcriptional regulator with XRE-family HTH domain